jgi:hypothetical protein
VGPKKTKRKNEGRQRSATPTPRRAAQRVVPSNHREQRFTSIVPVRFEPSMVDEIRRRAFDDGRSVSAWIRRAVEAELERGTGHLDALATDAAAAADPIPDGQR